MNADVASRIERRKAVLRDVVRSGGRDRWSHLKSHGHHFSSVWACVHAGELEADGRYRFSITDAGRAALAQEGDEG